MRAAIAQHTFFCILPPSEGATPEGKKRTSAVEQG